MAEETILIIDDDDDICLAIKTLLESRGYKAETASTKEEGMEKFLSVRPDLAILDADGDAGDEEWLPVEGFLDKPVEPDVLLAEVEKLLQK